MAVGYGQFYTSRTNPVNSVSEIKAKFPNATDGNYWINIPSVGTVLTYCILNNSIEGGNWMALTPEMSPQNDNNYSTSATWKKNTNNRLYSKNQHILNVNVDERDCGDPSFYQLRSPADVGFNYTETMLLILRISTIGQCSAISGQTANGYFSGPEFNGSFTSSGMCTWGDGAFANVCCGAQNMTNLQQYWIIRGSGSNQFIRYQVQCAGGSGQHYHMWFVK
jgi:hypothetical protein